MLNQIRVFSLAFILFLIMQQIAPIKHAAIDHFILSNQKEALLLKVHHWDSIGTWAYEMKETLLQTTLIASAKKCANVLIRHLPRNIHIVKSINTSYYARLARKITYLSYLKFSYTFTCESYLICTDHMSNVSRKKIKNLKFTQKVAKW